MPRGKPGLSPFGIGLALSALVLSLTVDERVFGLITDGQMVTRTAFSIAELSEVGIARGFKVAIPRPEGDAVTRYGMGASLAQVPVLKVAGRFESSFGVGSSQTLFALQQILWILLAAAGAGWLVLSLGGDAVGARRAILSTAIASPLWAYAGSDFSEPLQAALVSLSTAAAVAAAVNGADRGRGFFPRNRMSLLGLLAGALAGYGLLTKSVLIALFPIVLGLLWGAREGRGRRLLCAFCGWLPLAGLWLAFEIARFSAPFASYQGEGFTNPLGDGLWRLTVGLNKGLFLYFPLSLLAVFGLVRLVRERTRQGLIFAALLGFFLLTTATWWAWDGTAGWGPRLLMPAIPLLAALATLTLEASVAEPNGLRMWTFRVLFAAGIAVNAIGVLQPDALTTFYFGTLPARALTDTEAARYPRFAMVGDTAKPALSVNSSQAPPPGLSLLAIHDVARDASLTPLRVAPWLLGLRLSSRDPLASLGAPPWQAAIARRAPDGRVEPPHKVLPPSALVFMTTPFRWPHLGMSLGRRAKQADTALAYVDALYDQALRAQDMKQGERAAEFGERLFALVPGPQTAVAFAEGLRLAGRKEGLEALLKETPEPLRGQLRNDPQIGMVFALLARDLGKETEARLLLNRVLQIAPLPRFAALASVPPQEWPPTLRDLTRE